MARAPPHPTLQRHSAELVRLREELRKLESALKQAQEQPRAFLKRSRLNIEAEMRAMFADPESAALSDREIARRTGLSPQTYR
jgi:hypothetical protein